MASTPLWPALAAVVLLLFSVASAQVCELDPYYYNIYRAEQVEELSRNCTTLDGSLIVRDNFTGSFHLPGVTNITGGLDVGNNIPNDITDVQLPDLEYVPEFRLFGVKNASMPRLSVVEGEVEIRSPSDGRYHFPSLLTVGEISMSGNLSSVTFESLRNASSISIDSRGSHLYSLQNLTTTVVDISFPVLERVGSTHLRGNISSFSAPELTTISPITDYISGMIWFKPYEPGFTIDLPKLAYVNGTVVFNGVVNNVSLPMLRNVTGNFQLDTSSTEPIAIDLPIEYADEVELRGNIDSISLPNLRNYSQIRVNLDDAFDCDGFAEQLNETVTTPINRHRNFRCSRAEILTSKSGIMLIAVVVASLWNIVV
ncbi:hypothetical protein BJY00DRAFT_294536 [Aspergillus carlsbadensis]|nr:hypothetical protein BJY00DRAFT_294536 [Aspergillus carlsbadensis]